MLRARALKAGSAAGFPGSTLPTESVLIKIFQFKHKVRGRGSGQGPGGDVLVTSAWAAGFVAGLERVRGARSVGSETPSCTPSPGSLPPAGLNINSADFE